ncbi:response regulator transcription factor [Pseudoalteromonas sp. G4]|uniref:response regulator transcription factor n=1 Tax=Pseudoalteromonas sp. G4 TaxID=2992761 RepID=UPI00237E5C03|nr:response regulator transcription factor [Pseudoalteromonas sp. G4]MDE3272019.1 response regulator transcription factor [Pseudoalteromonas sp. G4]
MKEQQLKVLLIEDNVAISNNIATFFDNRDAVMDFAYDGEQGASLALAHFYDCIILDIALPKKDGLAVCQELRSKAERHIPIIMLTARDTLSDKVTGFELGADDYLTKPFELEELYLRCLAITQRHQSQTQSKQLQLGKDETELVLDFASKRVLRAGAEIHLQPIGFAILRILMEAYPRAVSRSELCDKIWGDEPTDSDALRSHFYQLRKVLDKPFAKPIIKTIHGVGFSLTF